MPHDEYHNYDPKKPHTIRPTHQINTYRLAQFVHTATPLNHSRPAALPQYTTWNVLAPVNHILQMSNRATATEKQSKRDPEQASTAEQKRSQKSCNKHAIHLLTLMKAVWVGISDNEYTIHSQQIIVNYTKCMHPLDKLSNIWRSVYVNTKAKTNRTHT